MLTYFIFILSKKLYYNIVNRRYFRRSNQNTLDISNLTYYFFFLISVKISLSTIIAFISKECYNPNTVAFDRSKQVCGETILSIKILDTTFQVNLYAILILLSQGYRTLHRMVYFKIQQKEFIICMMLLTLFLTVKDMSSITSIGRTILGQLTILLQIFILMRCFC